MKSELHIRLKKIKFKLVEMVIFTIMLTDFVGLLADYKSQVNIKIESDYELFI